MTENANPGSHYKLRMVVLQVFVAMYCSTVFAGFER